MTLALMVAVPPLVVTPAISAGMEHTVGLKADGSVVAVGRGAEGQLNTSAWTDVVAVAAGAEHTVGLRADGELVGAGDNSQGQYSLWSELADPPLNALPVAVADSYATPDTDALTVPAPGILANDVDADGDTLRAMRVSGPTHGALTVRADGSFVYTPTPGYAGTDTFAYRSYDGIGYSDVVTVSILVDRAIPPIDPTRIEHDAAGVTFDRFVAGYSPAYSGGGYVYGHGKWPGTRIQVRFSGTAIRWYGPKQPNYGMADVYIDGVKQPGFADAYASEAEKTIEPQMIFEVTGLDEGPHVLEIRPRFHTTYGGSIVVMDYFEVEGGPAPTGGGERRDELTGTLSGPWIRGNNSAYINKAYHYSKYTNASFTMSFTGTKIAWIGPKTGGYGRAKVWIDGVYQGVVSQYGTLGWRERVWESKTLSSGNHTITIRPTGTKDAASKGTIIVIDAFDVTP